MLEITGDVAQLKVAYQLAADFHSWKVVRGAPTVLGLGDSATFTGKVRRVDRFWSTRRPMSLWLMINGSWWVWESVDTDNGILPGGDIAINISGSPDIRGHNRDHGVEVGHGTQSLHHA